MERFEQKVCAVCEHFPISGKIQSVDIIKNGNINKTYCVNTLKENGEMRQYIVQSINQSVFSNPDHIIENVAGITAHLCGKLLNMPDFKRKVMRIFQSNEGKYLYSDGQGEYWRVVSYIFNSQCINTPNIFSMEKTGKAFGNFQALLSDYPITTLHETIKDFHNTVKRINDLKIACQRDICGRFTEVQKECDYIISHDEYISFFENEKKSGTIPLRVTHNDTKCNNVMFDKDTCEPLAVIDLDTVMPGFSAYDFGDAVRFGANYADEDEQDLSKVGIDLGLYEAFCKGYIPEVKNNLSMRELETLYLGVIAITIEISARFMTDYLNGDVYFVCRREKHNYYRAMSQIALLKDEISKIDKLKEISHKYIR